MANISALTSAFKSALLDGLGVTKTKNDDDGIKFSTVTNPVPHGLVINTSSATRYMQLAGTISSNATVTVSTKTGPSDRERIERLESVIKVLLEHATPEARMAVEVLCEQ